MKKLLSAAVAMVLCLSMALSMLAANGVPSVTQDTAPEFVAGVENKVDGSENAILASEVSMTSASEAVSKVEGFKEAYDEVVKTEDYTELVENFNDYIPDGTDSSDYQPIHVFDVEILKDFDEDTHSVTLSVRLPSLSSSDTVIALHKGTKGWEVVPCTVDDNGFVTFTLTNFSPVAFLRLKRTGVSAGGPSSPATGELAIGRGFIVGAVAR